MYEKQLQDHVNKTRELSRTREKLRAGDPLLPLSRGQSVAQAVRLRLAGMAYPGIAVAMRVYHGDDRSADAWRYACRTGGCPPLHYENGNLRRVYRSDSDA